MTAGNSNAPGGWAGGAGDVQNDEQDTSQYTEDPVEEEHIEAPQREICRRCGFPVMVTYYIDEAGDEHGWSWRPLSNCLYPERCGEKPLGPNDMIPALVDAVPEGSA